MESGIRSDIGIKIYGDDFKELIRLSDEVQKVLVQIRGQSDIAVDQITGQPTIQIMVNQKAIARYGIPSKQVLDLIECVGGINVGEVYEGQKKFPLVLRLPDKHRSNLKTLADTILLTSSGEQIPLKKLVEINKISGSATINREWGRRLIRVQCNVTDRDVSSFVAEAREKINSSIELPESYVIDWGGQFENLERARLRLSIVVPATLLLVFFMLYLSLNNLRDVLIIYTGIPFALIGGIFALWIREIPFSVSAAVGFIALTGIAVLNGQILVSSIRYYIDKGLNLKKAVTKAAHQRLRPVLATAITDAIGFFPMAISTGVGAEVQRPLASVVIGGVITSTILTLLVLPLLYMIFKKNK
jgi:cobalt-zinc-cadmium resistance protein CzcA